MAERSLIAQFRMLFSVQGMSAMQKAMRNIVQGLNNVEGAIQKSNAAFRNLADTGTAMVEISQSFLDPLQQASSAYVQRFGMMEATSARWIQSTLKLEQAQVKLGRSATRALQPLQDQMVGMMEKVADFVDAHPELLKAAVGTAGTLLTAGTAMAGIARAGMMINQLRSSIMALNATGGIGGAMGALGIAGVGLAASPTVGMALGKGVGQVLGGQFSGEAVQNQQWGDVVETSAKVFVGAVALTGQGLKNLYLAFLSFGKDFADWWDTLRSQLGENSSPVMTGIATAVTTISPAMGSYLLQQTNAISPEQSQANIATRQTEYDTAVQQIDKNLTYNLAMMSAWADGVSESMKQVDDSDRPLGIEAGITEDLLNQFEQYELEVAQQKKQFDLQAEQQNADHLRQMNAMDEDYRRQKRQAEEDFNREQKQSLDDFNRQSVLAQRDFDNDQTLNTDEFRRDELQRQKDFNLERLRAEEDHKRNILDAASRLDALGVIQEQRQYATDSRRARQDFDKETKLNQDNFARQQKLALDAFRRQQQDAKNNFDIQRRLSEDNYRLQQRRAQEEYNIQRSRAAAEFAYQRDMQRRQYEQELQLRAQAYAQQIQMQLRQYTMTADQSEAYYSAARVRFLNFLGGIAASIPGSAPSGGGTVGGSTHAGSDTSQHGASGTIGTFAVGGYSGAGGLARLHKREFIMSQATTSSAERMVGAPLTQSNLLRAMGGLGNLSVQVANTFENVGAHSIEALSGMVERATEKAMTKIIGEYVASAS